MKKFTIHYNYYATIDVDVLADSEDEAIVKARKIYTEPRDYNFTLNEESIIASKDVPDLSKLISEAEEILKEAEYLGEEFILSKWPSVTIQVWDGERMLQTTQTLENIYYDEEQEEIGFETDYNSELTISDIPEAQQLDLCIAIIEQSKNGIIR